MIGGKNTMRCDTDWSMDAVYSGTRKRGCLFNGVSARVVFARTGTEYNAESAHIYTALNSPGSTIPSISGKTIPSKLTRTYDGTNRRRNHDKASAACDAYYPSGWRQGDTYHCDEYPFQSTFQGAYFKPSNFSVKKITATANTKGGSHLGAFYNGDRICDTDSFTVVVT